jgi:hypothetical protein
VPNEPLRNAFLTLLAFFAITGIAFAISDTVRLIVCSALQVLVYGLPTDSDRAQAQRIRNEIVSTHHFAHTSLSQPGQPPVFYSPGSKMLLTLPAVVHVYDVQDRTEQDRIAAALMSFVAKKQSKPCKICFYDRENWIIDGNSGTRGLETQLRCVRITADRVQDISGQKIINYHPGET